MKKTTLFLVLLALLCFFSGCEEAVDPDDVIGVSRADLVETNVTVTFADGYTHPVGTLDELLLQALARDNGTVGIRACSATGAPGAFRHVFGDALIQTEITDRGIARFCTKINDKYYGNFNYAVNNLLFQNTRELVIPETADGKTVTVILPTAYADFVNLQKVTIPASVTCIEGDAFNGCNQLTEIHFQGTMNQWNSISKGAHWDAFTPSYTVICSDGSLSKTN